LADKYHYVTCRASSDGSPPFTPGHFFGDRNTFEIHPAFNTVFAEPPEGGVKARRYSRISDMSQEGIDARTYGGMHFRGSSEAAARVGARIADYVLQNAAKPIGRSRGTTRSRGD
jgi:hypothetical protein